MNNLTSAAAGALPRYARPHLATLRARLAEPRRFLQVLAGPRQAGKTTLVRQTLAAASLPAHYASADTPTLEDRAWIAQQWERGRLLARDSGGQGALLVLDEVQKVGRWSDVVKSLWDEDTRQGVPLKVVLLGSAPLLLRSGLSETLAGRFEILHIPHWSFPEMRDAFGWDVDRYLFFGGYPGAAPLAADEARWRSYVLESLVETTLSRDVLLLTRVDKPALLRRLFELACAYSGQILSYQKMLGQLQEAGNTTTLAHYLELLEGAGMVAGLGKFSGSRVRARASSPKLQVLNTGLMSALSGLTFDEARADRDSWGRLVESAVGAHLRNASVGTRMELFYWRERGREVDFVLRAGPSLTAFEVKSGRSPEHLPGVDAFRRAFGPARVLLVGGGGIPLDEVLSSDPARWV
jgi:uncharacterized protein